MHRDTCALQARRFELQAQRRRGCFLDTANGTKQNPERFTRLGGKLQAPQGLGVGVREPGEHHARRPGTQRLLYRPQPFLRVARMHDEHAREIDTGTRQRRRIRNVRRRDEHQPALVLSGACQRRHEQGKLADTFARDHDLGERTARQPPARQQRVEPGKTRG